tara:strand:- start:19 stop:648 length:630 start_codon:yes stop_codon:yes gene_type:complete
MPKVRRAASRVFWVKLKSGYLYVNEPLNDDDEDFQKEQLDTKLPPLKRRFCMLILPVVSKIDQSQLTSTVLMVEQLEFSDFLAHQATPRDQELYSNYYEMFDILPELHTFFNRNEEIDKINRSDLSLQLEECLSTSTVSSLKELMAIHAFERNSGYVNKFKVDVSAFDTEEIQNVDKKVYKIGEQYDIKSRNIKLTHVMEECRENSISR